MPGSPRILIHPCSPLARMPTRGYPDDVGFDLFAANPEPITLGYRRQGRVPTGLCMAIPVGYYGHILEKSGLAHRYGIQIMGGIIDPNYFDEVEVIVRNVGNEPYTVLLGQKIAQIAFLHDPRAELILHPGALPPSARGAGFGSSGR